MLPPLPAGKLHTRLLPDPAFFGKGVARVLTEALGTVPVVMTALICQYNIVSYLVFYFLCVAQLPLLCWPAGRPAVEGQAVQQRCTPACTPSCTARTDRRQRRRALAAAAPFCAPTLLPAPAPVPRAPLQHPLMQDLADYTKGRMRRVVAFSLGACSLVYVVAGGCGYAVFGRRGGQAAGPPGRLAGWGRAGALRCFSCRA